MKTIFTKAEQAAWCNNNGTTLTHHWSCRGEGSSRIFQNGDKIASAGGCGYDRFGAALGNAVKSLFPAELKTLALRHCKGPRYQRKTAKNLYGLSITTLKSGRTDLWLDGACGEGAVKTVLNAIGFTLEWIGDTGNGGNNGQVFYKIVPLIKRERYWLNR